MKPRHCSLQACGYRPPEALLGVANIPVLQTNRDARVELRIMETATDTADTPDVPLWIPKDIRHVQAPAPAHCRLLKGNVELEAN